MLQHKSWYWVRISRGGVQGDVEIAQYYKTDSEEGLFCTCGDESEHKERFVFVIEKASKPVIVKLDEWISE